MLSSCFLVEVGMEMCLSSGHRWSGGTSNVPLTLDPLSNKKQHSEDKKDNCVPSFLDVYHCGFLIKANLN